MAKKPQSKSTEVKFDHGMLREIVEATHKHGFMHVDGAKVVQHVKACVIEVNPDITDDRGFVAARATEKGLNYFNTNEVELTDKPEIIKETALKHETKSNGVTHESAFVIDSDVEMPKHERKRGAGRKFTYPFEHLQVGQSFHIPATEECPEPHKSRASLISLANNRYAKESGETETVDVNVYATDSRGKRIKGEDGGFIKHGKKTVTRPKKVYERRFSIHAVDHSDKRGPGARVFRVA